MGAENGFLSYPIPILSNPMEIPELSQIRPHGFSVRPPNSFYER